MPLCLYPDVSLILHYKQNLADTFRETGASKLARWPWLAPKPNQGSITSENRTDVNALPFEAPNAASARPSPWATPIWANVADSIKRKPS